MSNHSTKGFELIKRRRGQWTNEEEVRHAWMKGLEEALEMDLDAERARRDSSYNNVVIEFKAPGLFRGSTQSASFIEATHDRLLKYITRLAADQGLDEVGYIGVAIDGDHVAFAQVQGGIISCQPLIPFSVTAFQMVVDALKANFRRAVTAENLAEDFGHNSEAGQALMQVLSDALAYALKPGGNRKVNMLFAEWATLYGQAADLSTQQRKKVNGSLGFSFNGPIEFDELPAKLFVTHTFHSLLIKLIAAEIAAAHGMASSTSLVHELLAIGADESLRTALTDDVERGGFFHAVGLHGFVEEAIFSWYLDAAHESAVRTALWLALRALLAQLSVYRFDTIRQAGRSRDVLRDFYQALVPESLRRSLGEFYTPDWLVEHAVAKLGYDDEKWLTARVLDPTCGSGSFLVEAIAHKRRAAHSAQWDAARTVDMLVRTVWGFDINPLAVQSARVNFLIAVADLLQQCKGKQIEIPVLLADAVYSPAPDPNGDQQTIEYTIGSEHANLTITLPAALALDRLLLDKVFQVMGSGIEDGCDYSVVEVWLSQAGLLSGEQALTWGMSLKNTYDRVLTLHQKNWNGIWFRLVRNFFWSATAGRFDAIVGNPPWVRWSNLPDAYRNRAKPTCEKYAIFSDTKFHGGNELDISAIITYTTADKWLIEGGRLVFLITQTVFQSPSSQGFRRFRLNAYDRLVPLAVDDMKELKPFPDAANRTAVAMFTKRRNGTLAYPVDYQVWLGKPRPGQQRRVKSIDPRLERVEVMRAVDRLAMEANPVSTTIEGAPWAIMLPGHFSAYRTLFSPSTWVNGRKGITTDLNGIYFVEIIDTDSADQSVKVRTRPGEGKTDIGSPREFWVEASGLYPLAKGAGDFRACYFRPENVLYAFVPNRGIDKAALEEANACYSVVSNPKTYRFFSKFKAQLQARSTFRTRMKGAPFFSIYNVGEYSFAPFKVIWAEMTGNFCAAVISSATVPTYGTRPYVADHKLYFADFDTPEPAYYLCGLLHSQIVKEMIEAHNVSINMGDVLKHVSLPAFDSRNNSHLQLAALVEKAHGLHAEGARAEEVSRVRDAAAAIIRTAIMDRSDSAVVT